MKHFYTQRQINDKSKRVTLCINKNWVTVYDDAAKILNAIVVSAVLVATITYVAKALR